MPEKKLYLKCELHLGRIARPFVESAETKLTFARIGIDTLRNLIDQHGQDNCIVHVDTQEEWDRVSVLCEKLGRTFVWDKDDRALEPGQHAIIIQPGPMLYEVWIG